MSDEAIQAVGCEQSVRVPGKKNPYIGRTIEIGGYSLPLTCGKALYLPKISMQGVMEAAGNEFPSKFGDLGYQLSRRIDVYVYEEGFLVRFVPLKRRELHSLQARILTQFGAYTVAYDVVRLDNEGKQPVHVLRLVPWSTRPSGEEHYVAHETWESFNRRSDETMLSYVNARRVAKISTCAEQVLREVLPLPVQLPESADQQADQPEADAECPSAESTDNADPKVDGIHLCDVRDMEARIEREPNRSNGSGGSLPTLAKLCEEKLLVKAQETHVEAVAALHDKLPNFSPVIDYLQRKLQAQHLCGNPIRMPPILLVGDPGVGKSYFCRKLAEALDMPFEFIGVAGSSQELHITGLSKNWGTAGPSRFAEILAGARIANPLIMIDEIDKASDIKVENALLQVFEPETAARWVDQYVEVPIDLSRVLFIATANDETQLSPVLRSRFEVFDIQRPEDSALAAVFSSIYADEKLQFQTAELFSERLPNEVIERLIGSAMTPREARRLLLNAMELAIIRTHRQQGQLGQGSVVVQPDDMPMPRRAEQFNRIGFI